MSTRRAAALLLIAGGSLAVTGFPATAEAAPPPVAGNLWPGGVVPYHDATPPALRPLVREAVRQWNTSGLRIRFVAVPRGRAGVTIRGRVNRGGASGLATLGRDRRPGAGFVFVAVTPSDRGTALGVIVHELGHTLGLGHTSGRKGCSIMWPVLRTLDCPRSPDPDKELCSLVLPTDVRALARRYGMRAGARRTPPRFCLRGVAPPRPTVPTGLRGASAADPDGFTTRIVLTWTRWRPGAGQSEVVRLYRASCAARAGVEPTVLRANRSGARLVAEEYSGTRDATVCVEIEARTQNAAGVDGQRFGRGPAVARVDVALPPSPPPPPPVDFPPEEPFPVDPFPVDPFPEDPPPFDPSPPPEGPPAEPPPV